MEDKNRASEMLSQMKRYMHSDSAEKEAPKEEPRAEAQQIEKKAPSVRRSVISERSRAIPTDESLFEFDDITFDDVVIPEKPTLTPEEAVYAEELSEKFGVSRDAGVGFIDDSAPSEAEPKSFAPSASELSADATATEKSAFESEIESAESEVNEIADDAIQTLEQTEEYVEAHVDEVVSDVASTVEAGAIEAEKEFDEIAGEAQRVYDGFEAEVSASIDEIAEDAAEITGQTDTALDEIAAPAEAVAYDALQTVKDVADEAKTVTNEIAEGVEQSAGVAEGAVDEIGSEAQSVYSEIAGEVDTVVNELADEVQVIAPDFEPTLDSIANAIEATVEGAISYAESAITDIADEIETFLPEKDVPVAKQNGEPDQVVFGIEEQVKSQAAATPTGTQLTFLDAFAQIDERETSGEQVMFGDEIDDEFDDEIDDEIDDEFDDEFDYDDDDDDDDYEFDEIDESDDEPAENDDTPYFNGGAFVEQPQNTVTKEAVAEEIPVPQPEQIAPEAAETAKPAVEEKSYESPLAAELTPLEQSAIEEAERARIEAQAREKEEQEGERVRVNSFENDVWDDADRELYVAKKRYMEYCDQLSVPPIKHTKEPKAVSSVSGESSVSSGYRYEMTERLPLFTDGRNGGRKTESYVKREMEYCEEREKKRTSQLLDKMRLSGRRLIFSFVIMLTVILVENLNVIFTGKPDGLLNADNMMLLSLALAALLAIGAGLIYDGIRDGIKCAIKGVFIPETLSAGVSIVAVIYHIAIAFVGTASKYTMLFGTGAAVIMFLTGLYRYNMQKRDYITFSVAASYGSYLTEVKMLGFKNSPEGKAYEGYADPEAALYRMNRVARIDAPYNENPTRDECFGIMRKLTLCIICAAVVSGVVFGIIKNDVMYGVLSAISLLTLAMPASAFVALSVPRLRASSVSAEYGGAIADFDDESDEFDTSVIMIDDGELFPPENLVSSGFEMQRSPGIEIHLARTLALFKKIGGAMSALFSNVEGTIESFDSVVITEITENGISAKIDGIAISAGSEGYMERLGIKIKKSDKLLPRNGRVMYIADNGEFFARATLIFTPDAELVNKISELRNTNTLFSLKSCNPCIDKELVFYTTGLEPELLSLVKYSAADNVSPADTDREGSLVSKNGALGLLTALLEYKRQKKLVFDATRGACISCAIGIFLSLLVSAFGLDFGFSSLLALGFHGIMSLIGFVNGHRGVINTKSKIKKK